MSPTAARMSLGSVNMSRLPLRPPEHPPPPPPRPPAPPDDHRPPPPSGTGARTSRRRPARLRQAGDQRAGDDEEVEAGEAGDGDGAAPVAVQRARPDEERRAPRLVQQREVVHHGV